MMCIIKSLVLIGNRLTKKIAGAAHLNKTMPIILSETYKGTVMANPLVNFVQDELSFAAQHLVSLKVNDLINLKNVVQKDLSEAHNILVEMAKIWLELKPAENIVRALFPTLNALFDVLDKAASLDQQFLAVTK